MIEGKISTPFLFTSQSLISMALSVLSLKVDNFLTGSCSKFAYIGKSQTDQIPNMRKYVLFMVYAAFNIGSFGQGGSIEGTIFQEENFTVHSPSNIYNSVPFDNPQQNFPLANLSFVGDLNGDGFDDGYFNAGFFADERTPDENDRIFKSYIVFGGSDLNALSTITLYYQVYPVGDINGDNKDDLLIITDGVFRLLYGNSKTSFTNGSKVFDPAALGYSTVPTEINGFSDFDGDGYGDIALEITSSNATVIYGALFDNLLSYGQFNINYRQGGYKDRTIVGHFGSIPSRILSMCVEEGDLTNGDSNDDQNMVFEVFNISTGSVVLEESFTYATYQTHPPTTAGWYLKNCGSMDVTGDGNYEWVFGSNNERVSYLYRNGDVLEFGGDLCELDYYNKFKNIGDLNGDGREDFMKENNNIGFTDENQSVIFGLLIDHSANIVGDFNADGFDDLSALTANSSESGYILFSSNASSILTQTQMFLAVSKPSAKPIFSTQNVGDFNGDGNEDFIYFSLGDSVWLFPGDPESTPISWGVDNPGAEKIEKIVSADYNGDGYNDIISVVSSFPTYDSSNIYFYFGSSSPNLDPDYMINSALWMTSPDQWFYLSLDGIGDINKDNYDDLVMSISSDHNNFTIIYGNENPENAETLPRSIPIATDGSYVSGRAESAGDLNNDGIDDFVLGLLPFDIDHSSLFGIFVYFGDGLSETINSYSTPDLLLYEELPGGYLDVYGINVTVGDYNGDGISDIAAIPWRYIPSGEPDPDGYEMLYIYYGGTEMDYFADVKIKLPHRMFGVNQDGNIIKFHAELSTIPDVNGDDCNELFLGNFYQYPPTDIINLQKYAVILFGGNSLETGILEGYNLTGYGQIGVPVNGYYYSDFKSAAGDFNNDGNIELLATCADGNYQGTSVYEYRLKDNASVIYEKENLPGIGIFPNPASSVIKLMLEDNYNPVLVNIYNTSGAMVLSQEASDNEEISINRLKEGIYTVHVTQNNRVYRKKLIVIK